MITRVREVSMTCRLNVRESALYIAINSCLRPRTFWSALEMMAAVEHLCGADMPRLANMLIYDHSA